MSGWGDDFFDDFLVDEECEDEEQTPPTLPSSSSSPASVNLTNDAEEPRATLPASNPAIAELKQADGSDALPGPAPVVTEMEDGEDLSGPVPTAHAIAVEQADNILDDLDDDEPQAAPVVTEVADADSLDTSAQDPVAPSVEEADNVLSDFDDETHPAPVVTELDDGENWNASARPDLVAPAVEEADNILSDFDDEIQPAPIITEVEEAEDSIRKTFSPSNSVKENDSVAVDEVENISDDEDAPLRDAIITELDTNGSVASLSPGRITVAVKEVNNLLDSDDDQPRSDPVITEVEERNDLVASKSIPNAVGVEEADNIVDDWHEESQSNPVVTEVGDQETSSNPASNPFAPVVEEINEILDDGDTPTRQDPVIIEAEDHESSDVGKTSTHLPAAYEENSSSDPLCFEVDDNLDVTLPPKSSNPSAAPEDVPEVPISSDPVATEKDGVTSPNDSVSPGFAKTNLNEAEECSNLRNSTLSSFLNSTTNENALSPLPGSQDSVDSAHVSPAFGARVILSGSCNSPTNQETFVTSPIDVVDGIFDNREKPISSTPAPAAVQEGEDILAARDTPTQPTSAAQEKEEEDDILDDWNTPSQSTPAPTATQQEEEDGILADCDTPTQSAQEPAAAQQDDILADWDTPTQPTPAPATAQREEEEEDEILTDWDTPTQPTLAAAQQQQEEEDDILADWDTPTQPTPAPVAVQQQQEEEDDILADWDTPTQPTPAPVAAQQEEEEEDDILADWDTPTQPTPAPTAAQQEDEEEEDDILADWDTPTTTQPTSASTAAQQEEEEEEDDILADWDTPTTQPTPAPTAPQKEEEEEDDVLAGWDTPTQPTSALATVQQEEEDDILADWDTPTQPTSAPEAAQQNEGEDDILADWNTPTQPRIEAEELDSDDGFFDDWGSEHSGHSSAATPLPSSNTAPSTANYLARPTHDEDSSGFFEDWKDDNFTAERSHPNQAEFGLGAASLLDSARLPPAARGSGHVGNQHLAPASDNTSSPGWGWNAFSSVATTIGNSLAPHDFGHEHDDDHLDASANVSAPSVERRRSVEEEPPASSNSAWFTSLSSQASTFASVFETVKFSAEQSGRELFHVGTAYANDVLQTVKPLGGSALSQVSSQSNTTITTSITTTSAFEATSTDSILRSEESEPEPEPVIAPKDDFDIQASSEEAMDEPTPPESPASAGHLDNDRVIRDLKGREVDSLRDEAASMENEEDESSSDHAIPRESPCPQETKSASQLNVNVLSLTGSEAPATFAAVFAENGAEAALEQLEAQSSLSLVLIARITPKLRSRGTFEDAFEAQKNIMEKLNCLQIDIDLVHSHDPGQPELLQLIESGSRRHLQVLQRRWPDADREELDHESVFAQVHSLCSRSFALLSAQVILSLCTSAAKWHQQLSNGAAASLSLSDSDSDVLKDCEELRLVFECFGAHLNEVVDASVQTAAKTIDADSLADEIEMLRAELDLEASEALSKLEDAIEAISPILQARMLQLHYSL